MSCQKSPANDKDFWGGRVPGPGWSRVDGAPQGRPPRAAPRGGTGAKRSLSRDGPNAGSVGMARNQIEEVGREFLELRCADAVDLGEGA